MLVYNLITNSSRNLILLKFDSNTNSIRLEIRFVYKFDSIKISVWSEISFNYKEDLFTNFIIL